jgi:hypothetical protein
MNSKHPAECIEARLMHRVAGTEHQRDWLTTSYVTIAPG